MQKTNYDVAKWWHDQGASVIPIAGTSKKCPIKWQQYQSQRPTENDLNNWFNVQKYNVAIVTGEISGVTVIDIDPPDGKQSIIDNAITLDIETRMHTTPRGGEHWFYKYNPEIKQNQNILPNVDIRNDGGYVVVFDGQDRKVSFDVELKNLKTLPTYQALVRKENISKDIDKTPENNPITELLNNGAKQGSRHQAILKLTGHFRHFSMPYSSTLAIMKDWNKKNNPPLSEYELTTQILDCYGRYAGHVEPLELKPKTMSEMISQKIPVPSEMFLLDGLLPRAGTSLLASAPKVGKSQFALSLAYALANGWQFLGRSCWNKEVKVLYVAMERSENTWISRIQRISQKNGAKDNFHFIRLSAHKNLVYELQNLAKENNYELIILDMVTQAINTKDENKYLDTYKELSRILKETADQTKAHVMGLYHTGKAKNKTVSGSLLGSQGFGGVVDQILRIVKKSDGTRVIDTEGNDGIDIDNPIRLIEDPETGFISSGGVFINEELERDAIQFLKNNPNVNQTEFKKGIKGGNEDKALWLKQAEEDGKIIKEKTTSNNRQSFKYRLADE